MAVTAQTAARFGLHAGSRMTIDSSTGIITLAVTAIVRPRQAGSTFWTQDPLASQPSLTGNGQPIWSAGVFADPGQLAAMQTAFTGPGLEMNWEFPLALGGVSADQAQGMASALNRATTVTLGLTGSLEGIVRGKAAALKALEIDPDLAEGHATLGMITGLYEHEWQKAEACFQRALEINPNYAIARMWYACFNLAPMGRLGEAAREARRARDIDPINQSVCAVVGMIDYWNRQFDQAIPELSKISQ